jgi:hypothetical protein
MALAFFSATGNAGKVVHVEYSDHFWRNNDAQAAAMTESARVNTPSTWSGFDPNVFFDAHANTSSAVKHLSACINQSNASSPLIIIVGGPMQTVGMALAASDPAARKFVTIISHSTWNDIHAKVSGPAEGLTGTTYSFNDLGALGAHLLHIRDQNQTIRQPYSAYSWLRESPDPRLQWLWQGGQVSGKNTFDCSDAGMVFFALTGDENPSPEKVRALLRGNNSPPPRPSPTPSPRPEPSPTPDPSADLRVVSMSVVDATNGNTVSAFTNDSLFDRSGHLTVRANMDGTSTIQSVSFFLDGDAIHTEKVVPYFVAGNSGNSYRAWAPPPGEHTLVATPYDIHGNAGASLTVSFNCVDSSPR